MRNIRVPVSEQDEESIQESFVLVLVTGGTLCMMKNNEGKGCSFAKTAKKYRQKFVKNRNFSEKLKTAAQPC